ncbi:MAG: FtsX-like permease family protein [Saprospiraceae bacterium]|nr:ABC transporter permease [Bacteroidia bacterium]NNE14976.1 FtsX-like permease family protein [Saprospiraceae bacterium]NNL92186.1 FtsX-like permease family protein [Saprospiraceae bacterium]
MILIFKIVFESTRQAFSSLIANKLRTFLSLLGITIGIFAIVAVKSAVDSLRDNLMEGISEIGTDVLYVEKFPWTSTTEDNYWKFLKRPEPSIDDYKAIKEKSDLTDLTAFVIDADAKNITYRSSSVSGGFMFASTYEFQSIQKLDFAKGRYFSRKESESGAEKIILGHQISKELFGKQEPIGREIKMRGKKYNVIGVLKEEGESLFNPINFDEVAWIPLNCARRFINLRDRFLDRSLMIKGKPDVVLEDLKSEITGILRTERKLRPKEEDDFSLMEMSSVNQSLEGFFTSLNVAGFVIGIFSLIVGMFSVANIMFVSVKERTNQIGVKMAIGAQKHVILWEFLIEGIILCAIGGLMGLVFVYGIVTLVSLGTPFKMSLSLVNMMYGIGASILVGLIAAIIPAIQASKLDPVVAIRK